MKLSTLDGKLCLGRGDPCRIVAENALPHLVMGTGAQKMYPAKIPRRTVPNDGVKNAISVM